MGSVGFKLLLKLAVFRSQVEMPVIVSFIVSNEIIYELPELLQEIHAEYRIMVLYPTSVFPNLFSMEDP
jgi:hypothetical protein